MDSNALNNARNHSNKQEWQQAISAYEQYLKNHPNDATALHELTILHVKNRDYPQAENTLKRAITLDSHNANLFNHLGNILKQQKRYQDSEHAFQQALVIKPDFIEVLNNLGTLAFSQQNWPQAIHYFQQALTHAPSYTDALYNGGMAYHKNHQNDEAIHCFKKLLQQEPNHIGGHYHLGKLYYLDNQLDLAITHLQQAIAINNRVPEIHSNLGHCYLKQQNYAEARKQYEMTLELDENDWEAHYNLGIVSEEMANIDLAIQHYQKAVAINPKHFASHNNLAIAFLRRQNLALALKHFEYALAIEPDNVNLQYNINAIKQDKRLEAAPSQYIKNLFDSYAKNFEQHLTEGLDYQVPEHLLAAAQAVKKLKPNKYVILDLGCGTGLAGELFKPYANTLSGVDISDNMIEEAAKKDIYDDLAAEEMVVFLENKKKCYDIILSADVFVYTGNLAAAFAACANSLKRGGLLIFSTETTTAADYTMTQSGRFAHNEDYLLALAKSNKLKPIYNELVPTRMQYDQAVIGRVMILRR